MKVCLYRFWVASALSALLASSAWAAGAAALHDEYAQIDVARATLAIKYLSKSTPADRQREIEKIKSAPGNYPPPVLYVLSNVLLADGHIEEAAFWLYAGQLRADFDLNCATNKDVRSEIHYLDTTYAATVNREMFQDLDKFKGIIARVVAWDKQTPRSYDSRWINLHDLSTPLLSLASDHFNETHPPLRVPQTEWDAIAEKTRNDYALGFNEFIASREQSPKAMGATRPKDTK